MGGLRFQPLIIGPMHPKEPLKSSLSPGFRFGSAAARTSYGAAHTVEGLGLRVSGVRVQQLKFSKGRGP